MADLIPVLLSIGSLAVVLSTVPFSLAAIGYRRRDNGLAFLLLVTGLGVWNAMFVAQLLSPRPIIQIFFLALSVVGAVLTGLGWLLFASTANSTPSYLSIRTVYAVIGVLGGIDIILAITAPVHSLYWEIGSLGPGNSAFARFDPAIGYWFHTVLLVGLFSAGTVLFADSWRKEPGSRYPVAYTVCGTITVLAVLGSNILTPGGLGIASIIAGSLSTIGWLQASRGRPLAWLRNLE